MSHDMLMHDAGAILQAHAQRILRSEGRGDVAIRYAVDPAFSGCVQLSITHDIVIHDIRIRKHLGMLLDVRQPFLQLLHTIEDGIPGIVAHVKKCKEDPDGALKEYRESLKESSA